MSGNKAADSPIKKEIFFKVKSLSIFNRLHGTEL